MHRSILGGFLLALIAGCSNDVHPIGTGPAAVDSDGGVGSGGSAGSGGAAGASASGGAGGDTTVSTTACTTDADCSNGLRCGYAVADHCAATGVCVGSNCQNSACITPAGACGCNGQSVEIVQMVSTGTNSSQLLYASAPYRGVGPCGGPTNDAPVACNDGTGATNCCGAGVTGGASCSTPDLECWTACTQGYHGHLVCSEGAWVAGKGLFPCGAGSPDVVACNDGTGATNCCGPSVASGAACSDSGLSCWSACSQGYRSQFGCGGGIWNAGHGLYPCDAADGGTPDAAK